MKTLADVAYTTFLGKPLIFYLGLATYALFLATAVLVSVRRKKRRLPLKAHRGMAIVAVVLATAHGLLSLSVYL
jgi:hypothetical protein